MASAAVGSQGMSQPGTDAGASSCQAAPGLTNNSSKGGRRCVSPGTPTASLRQCEYTPMPGAGRKEGGGKGRSRHSVVNVRAKAGGHKEDTKRARTSCHFTCTALAIRSSRGDG